MSQKKPISAEQRSAVEHVIAQLPYQHIDYQSIFAQNIKAFQDYIPDIADSFIHYKPETFELVATQGSVDLVDKNTEKLVFGGDAFRSSLLDFELYKLSPDVSDMRFNKQDNRVGFLHYEFLNKFVELQDAQEEAGVTSTFFPDSLGLMICFGLGTGFYLENLVANHQVNRLYIYEPNHDFFFASLHLIDWKGILETLDQQGSSLHLCLGGNETTFFSDLTSEMWTKGGYDIARSFLYQHYVTEEITKACDIFKQRSYELAYGFGFFDDSLMATAHHFHNLQSVPAIEIKEHLPANQDIPVFICGNGPSLDKNMGLIKANQDNAIIISCGTTIDSLLRNGIWPDFHVEQERTRPVRDRLLSVDEELLHRLPLLSMNTVSPDVFSLFERKLMGLKVNEPPTTLSREIGGIGKKMKGMVYCNPTVANSALTIAESLGFQNFYLIGTDLGFPQGQHHSVDSIYYKDGEDKNLYDHQGQDNIEMPGNFGGTVRTSYTFGFSVRSLAAFIRDTPHINCFNLSDGAQIAGATPLEPHLLALSSEKLNKKKIVDETFDYYQLDVSNFAKEFEHKVTQLEFEHYIDAIIEMTKVPLQNRQDAITNLYAQYVFAESGGEQKSTFLREMVRGSLLYTHTVLSRLLQSREDVEAALQVHQQGLAILRDYLSGMKVKFNAELLDPDKSTMAKEWIDKTVFTGELK
ncbi:motility associated factor glycosyltransferase family protein [Motilimonas pumila]|uniref:DUF115 domain-containing protein n=1 Tax=Motilimonas pumila TaxID=2303987 RepID=A0A418YGL2_9GAMM|nr:6-hydroxymethylpterin diphosphokinase MptE-like protein [Motilimonas pumila]RJG49002.1 DUF115 domain-containing protein [Motilimonas pumila]